MAMSDFTPVAEATESTEDFTPVSEVTPAQPKPTADRPDLKGITVKPNKINVNLGFNPQKEPQKAIFEILPPIPSYPLQDVIDKLLQDEPAENRNDKREALAKVFGHVTKPFTMGYDQATEATRAQQGEGVMDIIGRKTLDLIKAPIHSIQSGLDHGTAEFFENLELMGRFILRAGPSLFGGTEAVTKLFGKIGKEYQSSSQQYSDMATKEGIGHFEKLVTNALGNLIPGVANFAMAVDSDYMVPAIVGAEKAKKAGKSPFIGALNEASQTFVLKHVLDMSAQYRLWARATINGGAFAAMDPKHAVDAGFTGALLGLMSPGGHNLKDAYPNMGRSLPELREELAKSTKDAKKILGFGDKSEQKPLVPALRVGENVIEGKKGETHNDMLARQNLIQTEIPANMQVAERGFHDPNTGEFLDRAQAEAHIKENQPDVHARWKANVGDGVELHSADYAKALQETEAMSGIGDKSTGAASKKDIAKTAEENISENPSIEDLTKKVEGMTPDKSTGIPLDTEAIEAAAPKHEGILAKAQNAWEAVKAMGSAFGTKWKDPIGSNPFQVIWSAFRGDQTRFKIGVYRWAKAITSRFTPEIRESISKYAKAGGDATLIKSAIDNLEHPDTTGWTDEEISNHAAWLKSVTGQKTLKKYRDALDVKGEQADLAHDVRGYYDRKLQENSDAGILETGLGDYINRVVNVKFKNDENTASSKFTGEMNSGKFKKDPSYAKKRMFEHDWEVELLAARKGIKDVAIKDDIGELVAIYEQAFNTTVLTRRFVADLPRQNDPETGFPLAAMFGEGHKIKDTDGSVKAHVVNPDAAPRVKTPKRGETEATELPEGTNATDEGKARIDPRDYETIEHPAFKDHIWVGKDSDGKPIFLKADMKVHKSIAKYIKAELEPSKVQTGGGAWKVAKFLLKGSAEVKGTMMALSPFHQVSIGTETIWHGTNPFAPPRIDPDHPLTKALLQHGLELSIGRNEFMEGTKGSGLVGRMKNLPIPVLREIGKTSERYTEYMFGAPDGYLPRLKVQLAQDIYARNRKAFPKLSEDEVLFLTTKQANAITGGMDFTGMGVSKTTQDILRLVALAPDFLAARMTRGVQAVRPYGREQLKAIAFSAFGMYFAAKSIEAMFQAINPDENKINWEKPFSVEAYGKEYALRSWVGDFQHSLPYFGDPRSFLYTRINPLMISVGEYFLGRDRFGNVVDTQQSMKDALTRVVPIPGQGLFTKKDFNIWQSMLQAVGVTSFNALSEAEKVERTINQLASARAPLPAETKERRKAKSAASDEYTKAIKEGMPEEQARELLKPYVEGGKITKNDKTNIIKIAHEGKLAAHLPNNFPDAYQVWDSASKEEKEVLAVPMRKRLVSFMANSTPEEKEAFKKQMDEIRNYKGKSKRFSFFSRG